MKKLIFKRSAVGVGLGYLAGDKATVEDKVAKELIKNGYADEDESVPSKKEAEEAAKKAAEEQAKKEAEEADKKAADTKDQKGK